MLFIFFTLFYYNIISYFDQKFMIYIYYAYIIYILKNLLNNYFRTLNF